ncbi:SDR family NAD(P)-dependent oxidoreductase [Piscinibacter sp.]|jgi:NAD(P)-dependent dehydrogenase (short-subunit alcohol dehydrogenase family)|uniref:SDR family NAD(P)-dependent oxidoreductase n=1 Tax=Piscinibacter sp. TaxID=1903157 RepID=UPI00355A9774
MTIGTSGKGAELFDVSGKVALVTGAFSGLGCDFARVLGEAGAIVILAGRRMEQGRRLTAQLAQAGIRAHDVFMDVEQAASVDAAMTEILDGVGVPDILVNNAGVTMTKPLLDLDDKDWTSVIDVNLNGAWRVAQRTARAMKAAGRGGSIINISSILGLRVAQQLPAYAAAKAGLIQLTRAMALELARNGIRVNALAPGYVETPLNLEFFATEPGKALIKRIPQRRLGQSRELAGPLLLLASEASAYMTGAVLVVDGGHTINTL